MTSVLVNACCAEKVQMLPQLAAEGLEGLNEYT